MITIMKAVSLLKANGHADASNYPLSRIFLLADIITERLDRERADAAILMQLLMGSLFNDQADKDFKKRIKELTGDGR